MPGIISTVGEGGGVDREVDRGYFVLLLMKRDELAGSTSGTWPAPSTSRLSSMSGSSSSSLLSGTATCLYLGSKNNQIFLSYLCLLFSLWRKFHPYTSHVPLIFFFFVTSYHLSSSPFSIFLYKYIRLSSRKGVFLQI